MNPVSVQDSLVNQVFNVTNGPWDLTGKIDGLINTAQMSSVMSSIHVAALLMGFALMMIQVLIMFFKAGSERSNIMSKFIPLIFQVALIAAISSSPLYDFIVKGLIAFPAQATAKVISDQYMSQFIGMWEGVFGNSASAAQHSFTIDVGAIANALVTTLIAAIVSFCAIIVNLGMPILQGIIFQLLYLMGPICLIFGICEYTQQVAKTWVGLSMAVAWMGVMAALGQAISCMPGGPIDAMKAGSIEMDAITAAIYGAVSILVMLAAFPLSMMIFGSIGGGGGGGALGNLLSMGAAGATAGVAAGVVGGASVVAGAVGGAASKSSNPAMKSIGGALSSFSEGAANVSDGIRSISRGNIGDGFDKAQGKHRQESKNAALNAGMEAAFTNAAQKLYSPGVPRSSKGEEVPPSNNSGQNETGKV